MKQQESNKVNIAKHSSLSGINVLIDQSSRALLKFPMLEIIYDRFVEAVSLPMRETLNTDILLSSEAINSLRFNDYIQSEKNGSVFCIVKSRELSGHFMITLSTEVIFLFLSVLLGGEKKPTTIKTDIRPFTAIETEIIRYVIDIILRNLNNAFSSVIPLSSEVERLEIDKNIIKIAKPDEIVGRFRVNVKVNSVSGYFDVITPYSGLEPIKKVLSQLFLEDKVTQDPVWKDHLEREIKNTKVKLELVLDGAASRVAELLNLKVGNTVVLDKFAEEPLDVTVNGVKITMGKLGKTGDKVAIQLLDYINVAKFNHIL